MFYVHRPDKIDLLLLLIIDYYYMHVVCKLDKRDVFFFLLEIILDLLIAKDVLFTKDLRIFAFQCKEIAPESLPGSRDLSLYLNTLCLWPHPQVLTHVHLPQVEVFVQNPPSLSVM